MRRKSRALLREKDAWRLALTWKKELQGLVKLTYRSDGSESVIHSYEWVEFDLTSGGNLDLARLWAIRQRWLAAQAASVVWTLMSCCEGFSGHENSVFWKRVFFEYEQGENLVPDVSDAIRFFTNGAFPRFRLRVGDEFALNSLGAHFREFLDYFGPPLGDTISFLTPFLLPDRLERAIQVSFSMQSKSQNVLEKIPVVLDVREALEELPWAHSFNRSGVKQWFPCFELTEVDVSSLRVMSDVEVNVLIDFIRRTPLRMSHLGLTIDPHLPRAVFARLLLVLTNAEPPYHSCCIHDVSFTCDFISGHRIAAICSILPHTKSLVTLELSILNESVELSSNNLWNWIEYANFHPDVASSSWQNLRIGGKLLTTTNLEALLSMEGCQPLQSRAQVRLRADTVVQENPVFESPRLCILNAGSMMNLCFWESSPSAYWICVVVPGYGYGWVSRDAITQEDPKSASTSQLRALSWWSTGTPVSEHVELAMVLSILKRFGQHVQLLRAYLWAFTSPEHVYAILDLTPELTSLAFRHGGSSRSTTELYLYGQGFTYPLREFVLDIPYVFPSQEALEGPLRNVTALILSMHPLHSEAAQAEYIGRCRTLLELNPPLQYFTVFKRFYHSSDYIITRQKSQRSLGTEGKNGMAQGPFRHDCQLAFLSVLRRLGRHGAIEDRWEVDVIRQIFGLATSATEREVWVSVDVGPKQFREPQRRGSFWKQIFR